MVGPLTFAHSPGRPDAVYPDVYALGRELEQMRAGGELRLVVASLGREQRPNGRCVAVHLADSKGYVFDAHGADPVVVLDQLTHALRVAGREAAGKRAAA